MSTERTDSDTSKRDIIGFITANEPVSHERVIQRYGNKAIKPLRSLMKRDKIRYNTQSKLTLNEDANDQ